MSGGLNLGSTNTLTFTPTSATGYTPVYENSGTGSRTMDPTNILVNASITGGGNVVINGPGTVTFAPQQATTPGGGGACTGTTTVQQGTLIVQGFQTQATNPSVQPAINSSQIYIGTAGSLGGGVTATLAGPSAASSQINYDIGTLNQSTYTSNANVTVYANGELNLNGSSQGFDTLTLKGGLVQEGSATQIPTITLNGITTLASPQTALITYTGYNPSSTNNVGHLNLSGMTPTFTIASGSTGSGVDLQVDSTVQNGLGYTSTSGIVVTKTGAGTLVFTGDNTFNGVMDVHQGILNIQNSNALGSAGSSLGDTTNGTVVDTNAQLQLQSNSVLGDLTIKTTDSAHSETLTLNGTGISGTGALLNVSGNNTYNGFIDLGSSSRINANAGSTLTIANTSGVSSGIINGTSSGFDLAFGGGAASNIIVNGGIQSNVRNVSYDGTGILTLAGNDSYAGTTSVSTGIVRITNNQSLSGTGTTVTSGATLQLSGNISEVAAGGITISGTGTTTNGKSGANGAIENLSGTNSYAGTVTLAADARINADSGTTLTLNNTTAITGTHNLTLGGGGNINLTGAVTTGTGTLTVDTTGTVVTMASAPSGTTPTNTFTGLTTISAGTLAFAANYQMGTTNQINIASAGTLQVNNYAQSLGQVYGTGTWAFGSDSINSVVTINQSSTFSGTFTGTGTLIIAPGVTFTFGADFNDPNLNIILDGGTLNINGHNATFGNLTFENTTSNSLYNTSTLNFGTGNSVINFTGTVIAATTATQPSSALTLNAIGWTNNISYFYSSTIPDVAGRGSPPLNQIVFDTPTWTGSNTTWLSWTDGPDNNHQITPVPEPSFYGAVIVGLAAVAAGVGAVRRRSAKLKSA